MSELSGRGSRLVAVLVAIVVVVVVLGGLPGGSVVAESGTVAQSQPAVDNTVTRIAVHEDGSATWTVSIRTRLASDDEVREYEAFQERFRENTSRYLDPFRNRISGVVARAGNETGREMAARDFSATTSIQELPRRWGLVTYRFTWAGFAKTTDDRLIVGDIFQGGYYLAEDDIIVIAPPAGYTLASVSPSPAARENGTVRWRGPIDFADEHPAVIYEPAASSGATPPADTSGDRPWLPIGIGAVLLAVGGAYYLWRRRARQPGATEVGTPATGTATESTGDGGASAESGAPKAETPTAETSPTAVTGGETMTDEERVLELVDAHGGRVKQSAIAEEFDWSASKTSRVVSSMAESGDVEKLRVGRENLVSLPDEE